MTDKLARVCFVLILFLLPWVAYSFITFDVWPDNIDNGYGLRFGMFVFGIIALCVVVND